MSYEFSQCNDFAASLTPIYADLCERYFPDFLFYSEVEASANQAQLKGVDAFVLLANGKVVKVDTKADRYDSPRICLEILSNSATGAKGWGIKEVLNDYVLYLFAHPNRGDAYMFPTLRLQQTLRDNYSVWRDKCERRQDGFRTIVADNGKYVSISLGIPIIVLLDKLGYDCKVDISRKEIDQ